ncbi:MAG: nucleoside phosphorylase [Erysipelotrichaceae bacterium]|nr:nucleoside phosphorylase [Erysipelotrichaceae bacterium]
MAEEVMHHLKMSKGQIGKYVILPGDPGRVEKIAQYLDNPYYVMTNREYTTWNGTIEGETVTVMSTGMGGPSTAIAIEELKKLGAEVLIRVGTAGGIDPEVVPGTLIIPTGAIRKEGTTREYAPIEYPAVPDYSLVRELEEAAGRLGYPTKLGVSESKDSFYGQHSPESMPVAYELLDKWEAWKQCGAVASEMESAALFIVAGIRRMKSAAIMLLCRNIEREKKYNLYDSEWDTSHAIETAVEAIRSIILKEKNSNQKK